MGDVLLQAGRIRVALLFAVFVVTPCLAAQAQKRTITITIDDLPASEAVDDDAKGNINEIEKRNAIILETLRRYHARALGLVNEYKVQVPAERDRRAAILEQWLTAGMDLGNHTYSHVLLGQTTLADFEDDTVRGDVVTPALYKARNETERYFRHPGLNEGNSLRDEREFELFLSRRGYEIAPVTVNFDDYAFDDVLGDAEKRNDAPLAHRVKEAYLAYALTMVKFSEKNSQALFHRDITQLLLIHDSLITERMLGRLLEQLQRRGYRFVSTAEALQDSAYGPAQTGVSNLGHCYLCWGNRLRAAGLSPIPIPPAPAWITESSQRLRNGK